MQDCGTGILRLIKSRSCALCYLPICIFLHKLSVPLFFSFKGYSGYHKDLIQYLFYFFSEGTVTNPVIWLVLRAVRIFLSLPRGRVTFSWVAEYIPTFTTIFHKYISFFRLGNIFKQRRRSQPQADKQLIISLFSLSQIALVVRKMFVAKWICISKSVTRLVDRQPKNRL